jgi:hypothetical protein
VDSKFGFEMSFNSTTNIFGKDSLPQEALIVTDLLMAKTLAIRMDFYPTAVVSPHDETTESTLLGL